VGHLGAALSRRGSTRFGNGRAPDTTSLTFCRHDPELEQLTADAAASKNVDLVGGGRRSRRTATVLLPTRPPLILLNHLRASLDLDPDPFDHELA
jgi:hypothetical protein